MIIDQTVNNNTIKDLLYSISTFSEVQLRVTHPLYLHRSGVLGVKDRAAALQQQNSKPFPAASASPLQSRSFATTFDIEYLDSLTAKDRVSGVFDDADEFSIGVSPGGPSNVSRPSTPASPGVESANVDSAVGGEDDDDGKDEDAEFSLDRLGLYCLAERVLNAVSSANPRKHSNIGRYNDQLFTQLERRIKS